MASSASDSLEAAKQALRAQVALRLPPLDTPARAEASARAQKRLAESGSGRAAGCIALYRATSSECGTDLVAEILSREGKSLCYPKVLAGERVLRFLRPQGALQRSELGIDEHEDREEARVPLSEIDLFVVPARAVDAAGHRLGRGKGYFDATLAAAGPRARRICLVFDSQLVPAVPHAAHDERVDIVCTESRWIECQERQP